MERKTYDLTKAKTGPTRGVLKPYPERHLKCFIVLRRFQRNWWRDGKLQMHGPTTDEHHLEHQHSKLDLGLLLACRQIHREAALIPYVCNTFAFEKGLDLDLFVSQSLLAPQRKAIQSIEVSGWLHGYRGIPGVSPSTIQLLQGLEHLSVCVQDFRFVKQVDGPYLFSQLRLKTVRVIVELDGRYSNDDRLKCAKYMEYVLLKVSRRILRIASEEDSTKMLAS